MTASRLISAAVLALICISAWTKTSAQDAAENEAAIKAAVEAAVPAESNPAATAAGAPGNPPAGAEGKPGGPKGQPGKGQAKPGEAPKAEEKPKTISRPTKADGPTNPDELKILPDENGRVRFNFHGQPWQGVLEWLARVSDLSLDWQELPADFLNLRTQRTYTIDEARDLINRHLLDRGFTMLKHGEILSVVNVKKIDPSLVPRVAPDLLDEREPHEFVKASFPLDSLTAETAVDELKPMISPNGKISALKATNRVEVMDAAVNLREIRDMLAHEQSHRGRKRIVREFRLEYTRATEVMGQLEELLGLEKKKTQSSGPQSREQQMMMQQQMMMEQQQQQQGGPKPPPKQAPQVRLVANSRENSIVVQAPADQMAIVSEAVKLIDVPSSRSQSMMQNVNRTQVYRLAAIDPEPLIKMLEELGDLDPTTRLQLDKRNRSIIAHASLADHLTIRTLVNKLDGTDRKFEVIKLRRLEADYVAGTIDFMMGGAEKKKNQNNRFYPYFDYFPFGGRNNEQEDESRKFRVDADTEHNRLLVWANAVELDEINHLLVKLGEISGPDGNMSTLRVLDSIPPEEADQLLKKLRRTWKGIAPNPLEIAPQAETDSDEPSARKSNDKKSPAKKRGDGETTTESPRRKSKEPTVSEARLLRLIDSDDADSKDNGVEEVAAPSDAAPGADAKVPEDGTESEDPPRKPGRDSRPAKAPAAPAPIRVGRGPDGKIIVSSSDTQALDRLEDLVAELAPGRRDYKIFKLKYKTTWAFGVAQNLKEFFDEKEKNKQPRSRFDYFYGPMPSQQTDDERRLSKRRPLKFISDSDSNSILVTGADPNQLRIIEELIDLYDIPESRDSAAMRQTKFVNVKYSKAKALADTIKDVYRDLLSPNDPALQNPQNQQNKKGSDSMYTYINNFGSDDKKPDSPAKFKGQLSIGVVELSNTIVVSAGDGLAESVVETIETLDRAAIPMVNRMRVMKVDRTIDANELQKRLKNLVTKPPQPRPQQPQQQQQPQMPNPDSATFIDNN